MIPESVRISTAMVLFRLMVAGVAIVMAYFSYRTWFLYEWPVVPRAIVAAGIACLAVEILRTSLELKGTVGYLRISLRVIFALCLVAASIQEVLIHNAPLYLVAGLIVAALAVADAFYELTPPTR